jgi:hypothetical protein
MTQVLACIGANGNRATLEEMLPIVTYLARAKWGNMAPQHRTLVNSLGLLYTANKVF